MSPPARVPPELVAIMNDRATPINRIKRVRITPPSRAHASSRVSALHRTITPTEQRGQRQRGFMCRPIIDPPLPPQSIEP